MVMGQTVDENNHNTISKTDNRMTVTTGVSTASTSFDVVKTEATGGLHTSHHRKPSQNALTKARSSPKESKKTNSNSTSDSKQSDSCNSKLDDNKSGKMSKSESPKKKTVANQNAAENKENVICVNHRGEEGRSKSSSGFTNTDFHYNLFDAYVERLGLSQTSDHRKCFGKLAYNEPCSPLSPQHGQPSTEQPLSAFVQFDDKSLRVSLCKSSETPMHLLSMHAHKKQKDSETFGAWYPNISSEDTSCMKRTTWKQQSPDTLHLQFPRPRFQRSFTTAATKETSQSSVYERLMSIGRYKDFEFEHKPDEPGWYIQEYTARHTVGRVGHRNRKSTKLGVDVPDPYNRLCKKSRSPNNAESWQAHAIKGEQEEAALEQQTTVTTKAADREAAEPEAEEYGKSNKTRSFPVLAPVRETTLKKRSQGRLSRDGLKPVKKQSNQSANRKEKLEAHSVRTSSDNSRLEPHLDLIATAIGRKSQEIVVDDDDDRRSITATPSNSLALGAEDTFWENPIQDPEITYINDSEDVLLPPPDNEIRDPKTSELTTNSLASHATMTMYKKSLKTSSSLLDTQRSNQSERNNGRLQQQDDQSKSINPQTNKEQSDKAVTASVVHPAFQVQEPVKKHHLKTELETDEKSGRLMVKISVIKGGGGLAAKSSQERREKESDKTVSKSRKASEVVFAPEKSELMISIRTNKESRIPVVSSSVCDGLPKEDNDNNNMAHDYGNTTDDNGHTGTSGKMVVTDDVDTDENEEKKGKEKQRFRRKEVRLKRNEISVDSAGLHSFERDNETVVVVRSMSSQLSGKKKVHKIPEMKNDNDYNYCDALQLKSLEYNKKHMTQGEDRSAVSYSYSSLSPILALTRQYTSYQQIDLVGLQANSVTPVLKYTKLDLPQDDMQHQTKLHMHNVAQHHSEAKSNFVCKDEKEVVGSLEVEATELKMGEAISKRRNKEEPSSSSSSSSKQKSLEDDTNFNLPSGRHVHQRYPVEDLKCMVEGGRCGFIVKSFPLEKDSRGKSMVDTSYSRVDLHRLINEPENDGDHDDQNESIVMSLTQPPSKDTDFAVGPPQQQNGHQNGSDFKEFRDFNNNSNNNKKKNNENNNIVLFYPDTTSSSSPSTTQNNFANNNNSLSIQGTKSEERNNMKTRSLENPHNLYRPSTNMALFKMDVDRNESSGGGGGVGEHITSYEKLPSIHSSVNNVELKTTKDDLFISGLNTAHPRDPVVGGNGRRKRPVSLDRGVIDDLVRYHNETTPSLFRKQQANFVNSSNGSTTNNNNNNHNLMLVSHHPHQQYQQQQRQLIKSREAEQPLAPYAFGLDIGCSTATTITTTISPLPVGAHQDSNKSVTTATTVNDENDSRRQNMQIYAHVRKGMCADRQASQILPSVRHILGFNHLP